MIGMTKEMMRKSNQCQSFKKEWEVKQDEIYDPENDYFNVRKQESSKRPKYHYKPTYNRENPY